MKPLFLFSSIYAIAISAFCADLATTTTNTLNFFVVSEQPITGGRHVDTAELPKLGYIKAAPSLVVTGLQSVVTNTAHTISRYAGKTTEIYEPALIKRCKRSCILASVMPCLKNEPIGSA